MGSTYGQYISVVFYTMMKYFLNSILYHLVIYCTLIVSLFLASDFVARITRDEILKQEVRHAFWCRIWLDVRV